MSSPQFHKISSLSSYVMDGTQRVYDALFCDIWGVLHNGVVAFEPTIDALMRFRHEGGSVILLSNAPRSGTIVREYLERLHVPQEAFDAIVTSGDVTAEEVIRRKNEPVYYLGPSKDHGLLSEFSITPSPLHEATYVLCSGLRDDTTETPQHYKGTLESMLARNLPMVCANPDRIVRRGTTLVYCAGALAEAYSDLGGQVIYAGKPYPPIYNLGFHVLTDLRETSVPRARILVIGDSVETDIRGASRMNLDSVFVYSGIHTSELSDLDDEMHLPWFQEQLGVEEHPADARHVNYALMPKVIW
jgi:HAD superfamily hydrolase (TIGR01459 family)